MSSPTIDDAILRDVDTFFNAIVIPALCLFGIVGNAVNIVVLHHHRLKDTTTRLLLSLSMADLVFSVNNLTLKCKYVAELFSPVMAVKIVAFSKIFGAPMYKALIAVNVCHVTAIAAERVVAVYFPFHVARIFTTRRVKVGIACLYVIPLGMFSPFFFVLETSWEHSRQFNATVPILISSKFYWDNASILNVYSNGVIVTLYVTIVPALLLTCSVAISLKINRRKFRKTAALVVVARDKPERKSLKMLMTVSAVALFICLPGVTINLYVVYVRIASGLVYDLLNTFTNFLGQLHTCSNFIIYVLMSSKFSKIYLKLCCQRSGCLKTNTFTD